MGKRDGTEAKEARTRRGFMAKATAVAGALAVGPLVERLAFGQTKPAPPKIKLSRPVLDLKIRVPKDLEVRTTFVQVEMKHNFAKSLGGVVRTAKLDLTTSRTAEVIRDPSKASDNDSCCCVRG